MDPTTKVEDKKDEKSVVKSWGQMRKEAKAIAREKYIKKFEVKKDDKTPEVAIQPKEEVASEPEVKAEEPKVDYGEIAKQAAKEAANETATRVANETKDAFKEEVQRILDKDKSLLDKQKELDDLIPVYIKENRLPADYQEMVTEQLRVTEAKWEQKERERATKEAERQETPAPPAPPTEDPLNAYQKQIVSDLDELYSAKFLPKPANLEEINNPNTSDPHAKETQKVLAFGVKLNVQRKAQGLEPITSLNKIYFLHYKPTVDALGKKTDQPPGADAPISPSRNQSTTESNKPKPFYQKGEDGRYHAKSWAQIKFEALKSHVNK